MLSAASNAVGISYLCLFLESPFFSANKLIFKFNLSSKKICKNKEKTEREEMEKLISKTKLFFLPFQFQIIQIIKNFDRDAVGLGKAKCF